MTIGSIEDMKSQNASTKIQISTNTQIPNPKHYDLEERTLQFAKDAIIFIRALPKTTANTEIAKQLIRSASSVGANYIEANESLGKKDFLMRIKICLKEAKESAYWLKLIEINSTDSKRLQERIIGEALQLVKIFSAILNKSR